MDTFDELAANGRITNPYRERDTERLVDAWPAPVGITVRCGPDHGSETTTRRGDWIVLTKGGGYEVWTDTTFAQSYYRRENLHRENRELEAVLFPWTVSGQA
jgi:hypothetical protein